MGIKYLKEIAEKISDSSIEGIDRTLYRGLNVEIHREIESIVNDRQIVIELLDILFKGHISATIDFFNLLRDFAFTASFNRFSKDGRRLIGILLSESCKKLKLTDAERLLSLLSNSDVDIFLFLKPFNQVISEIKLSPLFVSTLFKSIEGRILNDLAGGDFYDAVEIYGTFYPVEGLKVIEIYFNEGFNDGTLHLAAILLGNIRATLESSGHLSSEVEAWDERLRSSTDIKARLCYHRSWVFTTIKKKLPFNELESHLNLMFSGEEDERSESYAVLQKCLINNLSSSDFLLPSLQWLKQHASADLSPLSKHYIVEILWRLVEPAKGGYIKIADLNHILLKFLPIPRDNKGTWNSLNSYLHDILSANSDDFKDALSALIDLSLDGFIKAFEENILSDVFSEASPVDFSEIVADLLFSANDNRRILGVKLFNAIKGLHFSKEMLANYDAKSILSALISFILQTYQARDIVRFFLLFEFKFADTESPDGIIFKDEMIYQAINYPEGVLGVLKQEANPSVFVNEVIKAADSYFEGLRKLGEAPVNSFAFAGYDEAAAKAYRDFSSRIGKEAREKSVLAKLVRNVDIIYGNTVAFVTHETIGSPTNFGEISHSIEFPRIEIIDPEGAAIRRMAMIRRLQEMND